MEAESNCIVEIAPCCNRVVFACVDSEDRRKENAHEVAKLIRAGYRIETWPTPKVRAADWMCECKKKGKAA